MSSTTAGEPGGESGAGSVRVLVLGPCRLEVDGVAVRLTAVQRRLLARLAATPRRSVAIHHLFDALWDGAPPATARAALHNQVSRIRALGGPDLVQTTSTGYLLDAETDAELLGALVTEAERVLDADPVLALDLVGRAQRLGEGDPYAELPALPVVVGRRVEVDTLLATAADLEVEAGLLLGRIGRPLALAWRLSAESPYDERRLARLARALDHAGRRGEALAEIARFRREFRSDLGIDPGPILADIETALLGERSLEASEPVGLEEEFERLHAAVTAGRSVALVGPPGSGVSRLLRVLRARLAGGPATVAYARVQGYRDVAVAPLIDLLEELGLSADPALGPVGSFLPAVSGLGRPAVLVVDDVGAAGHSTRRLLREAGRLDGVCLALGLDDEPDPTLPEIVDEIIELRPGEAHDRAPVVETLPPPTRRALVAAAVAGHDAPESAVTALAPEDGLADALAQGLLERVGGRIRFGQRWLEATVYADTPAGVREELHHALGTALAASGADEDAARHLLAAVTIEPAAAVRTARTAAARASAAGAHLDAVEWLSQALDGAGDLISAPLRLALQIELGDALRLAGDPAHVALLRQAVDEAERTGDLDLLGEAAYAYLQLGGTTVSTAFDPEVGEILERTLAKLTDTSQIAMVKAAGSLARSMTGNAEESRRLFLEAERSAGGAATRRRVLPFAYLSLGHPDDHAQRHALAKELVELGVAQGDPIAQYEGLQLLFSEQIASGDGAGARKSHAVMTDLVDAVGDVGRRWALLYLGAALAHLEGRFADSEQLTQAAFSLLEPVSPSRATAALYGQLFGLAILRGEVAAFGPFLDMLVVEQPGVPAWQAARALSLVDADPAQALSLAGVAARTVERDFTWLPAQLIGGRAAALAVLAGAPDLDGVVAEYAARLAPYSGHVTWQGTCSYGPVDTTGALLARALGDEDACTRLAAAARRTAEGLGAPGFAADITGLALP